MTSAQLVDLLTQLAVMLVAGIALGFVMRKFQQPSVVGEMAAGVVIGVTVLGSLAPDVYEWLFESGPVVTSTRGDIIKVGMLFFLYVAGSEIDLSDVKTLGRRSLIIGLIGTLLPIAGGVGLVYVTPVSMWGESAGIGRLPFAAFIGMNLANSANPVLARILIDLGLMKSRIATVMMTATVIDDLVNWTLYAIILGSVGTGAAAGSDRGLAVDLLLVGLLFVAVLGGVRWLAPHMVGWVRRHLAWPSGYSALVAVVVLAVSAVSEAIGVQAFLGAFLAGVAFSGVASGVGATGQVAVTHVAVGFFAPLFFVSMALKTDFVEAFDPALVATVIVFALASKLISVVIGVRAAGLPVGREAWAIAWGLNARGATGIILAATGLQAGIIDDEVFVALVVMAIVTSLLAGPMMVRALGPLRREMSDAEPGDDESLLAGDGPSPVMAHAARLVDRDLSGADRAGANLVYRVVAAIDDPDTARPLVELAARLAASQQPAEVVLVLVEKQAGIEDKARFSALDLAGEELASVRDLETMVRDAGLSAVSASLRTADMVIDLAARARELGAHALVVGDRRDDPEWVPTVERLVAESPADTYVVVAPLPRPGAAARAGAPVVEAGEGLAGEASFEAAIRFALAGPGGPVVAGISPESRAAGLYASTLERLARLGRPGRIVDAGLDTVDGIDLTADAPLVVRAFAPAAALGPIDRARPDAERFGCPIVLVAPDSRRRERRSLAALLDTLVRAHPARRVLVSVGESRHSVRMVDLAADLVADEPNGEVVITRFAPRDRRLDGAAGAEAEREIIMGWLSDLHDLARRVETRGIRCSVLYQLSDDVAADLVAQAREVVAELLVVGGPREERVEGQSALDEFAASTGLVYREFVRRVLDDARCDVGVLVHPTASAADAADGPVAVALGGLHDHAALELGVRVARTRAAAVELLPRPEDDGPPAADLAARVQALELPDVAVEVAESRDPDQPAHGAAIVTAGLRDWHDGSRFGTTLDALLDRIDCPVLAVRSLSPRAGTDDLPYALRLSTLLPAPSLSEL